MRNENAAFRADRAERTSRRHEHASAYDDADGDARRDRGPLRPAPRSACGHLVSAARRRSPTGIHDSVVAGGGRRAADCVQQALWDRLVEHRVERAAHLRPQRAMVLDAAGERRIGVDRGLDLRALDCVELAVRIRHQLFVGNAHGKPPSAPPSRASSVSRARASRLVTVPIGTSSTAAASLYA